MPGHTEESLHREYGPAVNEAARCSLLTLPPGDCVCLKGRPPRRIDPRYLPIGKASDDPFIKTVPIRGKKRARTTSSSPSRSASPTKGSEEIGDDDGFPETIIPKEEAAQIITEFRQNVISAGNSRCAVTGKGRAWWAGDCIGPGVQAAHIVPQVHWNVYPDKDQGVASLEDISVLRDAWTQTWHMSNGLLLAAHIHYSFDARILSIDPDTRRIRVFMPYDLVTEYHGKVAALPPKIDLHALRHHYDMCCVENLAAQKKAGLGISTLVRGKSTTISPAAVDTAVTDVGDPVKKGQAEPSQGNHGGGGDSSDQSKKTQEQPLDQPLSPPLSEPGEHGQQTVWRCGEMILTDPQQVRQLREKGWLVYDVGDGWESSSADSDGQSSDEEEPRGRPRKRQCTAR
jgi:hypothetical protein